MRTCAILCLVPLALAADDHWVKFIAGPYEVMTDASPRTARETLVRFEEFRHAVGQLVGEQDLQTPQPVRIMIFKNAGGWNTGPAVASGRDRYNIVLPEKGAVSPDIYRALTRLFLQSNTAQMPSAFENGLVEFLSTFQVTGIRITVGTPPPKPDLDWARIHLLVTDPEYFGKIRVLLFNLRRGVDQDAAFRNAFGQPRAEVEARVKQYYAAGRFEPGSLSSRPLSPDDFAERQVSETDARLARADLLAGDRSAAEYQALLKSETKIAEAQEGLGLLALRAGRTDDARIRFAAAMSAGSTSARCYIEYARLEPDNEKAAQALLRAAGINPKLDEPFALMARRDTDPRKRLAHWKAAAERNPREPSYWKELAECYLADHDYSGAAKAWAQGEQAATDPAERARMHQARISIEAQRLDYEEAERKRKAEEEARDIERLKTEARSEVRALERKYNNGAAPSTDPKAVPWWEGPRPPGKVSGTLRQVDCLGRQARLVIDAGAGKTVRLLVPDPGQIAIGGAGELALTCGPQKARKLTVEYFPKTNARLSTSGEVATIEFQ
jgi:hypothetical protein